MKYFFSLPLTSFFVLLVTFSQAQETKMKSKGTKTKVKTEAAANATDNSQAMDARTAGTLSNTSWTTYFSEPINDTLILHYGMDSSFVHSKTSGELLISSVYKISQDTLTYHDVSGIHACPDNMIGNYRILINGDVLKLEPISDECDGRADALKNITWQRLRETSTQKQP